MAFAITFADGPAGSGEVHADGGLAGTQMGGDVGDRLAAVVVMAQHIACRRRQLFVDEGLHFIEEVLALLGRRPIVVGGGLDGRRHFYHRLGQGLLPPPGIDGHMAHGGGEQGGGFPVVADGLATAPQAAEGFLNAVFGLCAPPRQAVGGLVQPAGQPSVSRQQGR